MGMLADFSVFRVFRGRKAPFPRKERPAQPPGTELLHGTICSIHRSRLPTEYTEDTKARAR
jgi:hypothetical protein